MDRVIFVEILDRRGAVVRRERIEATPFRIGRSLSCAVILDDAHASPDHLEIGCDERGALTALDLGSENGTTVLPRTRLAGRTPLAPGACLRVGRTLLRVRTLEDPLPPTVLDARGLGAWLTSHPSAGLLLLVLALGVSALRVYEFTWVETPTFPLVSRAFVPLLQVVFWAGGWALGGRLLQGRARFGAHWVVACTLFVVRRVIDEGVAVAAFRGAEMATLQYGAPFLEACLLAVGMYLHLGFCGVAGRLRRALFSTLVAFAVVGAFGVEAFRAPPDFTNELPFWTDLRYTEPEALPVREADEFFDALDPLAEELDALAAEAEPR